LRTSEERDAWKIPGLAMVVPAAALLLLLFWAASKIFRDMSIGGWLIALVGIVLLIVLASGFRSFAPNDSRVILFLGWYLGTIRDPGFWWTVPFVHTPLVSLRVRNFTSETLKVNDSRGNPIGIAAVVGWCVTDTAKALFDVFNFVDFVETQAESALRGLASHYPYDSHDEDQLSLLGNPGVISSALTEELEERLAGAGVEVIETRLTHLAYSPEIAQAMLRRQQAEAIIAARQRIVEGAVGMVRMALDELEKQGVVALDDAKRADMVNNLLV